MNRTLKTRPFDAAEFLDSDEMIAVFLADAFQSGEARIFQEALQVAARARGMASIAEASGLGRESLYKALRPDAQPRFETVRRVIEALGVTLEFSAHAPKAGFSVREPAASYGVAAASGTRAKKKTTRKKAPTQAVRKTRTTSQGAPASKRAAASKPAAAKATARKTAARRPTKSASKKVR